MSHRAFPGVGAAFVERALKSIATILFLLPSVLRADYSTNFDLTENPISEDGKWQSGAAIGLDWKDVRTSGGIAFGTQTGDDKFRDSTALLTGTWDPNQSVSGVVHTVNQITNSVIQEVEFRLRSTLSAHVNSGYEINFRCTNDGSQYVQMVKWNGPVGDFTYIDSTTGPGVRDGDTLKAEIIGTTINAYINGQLVLSRTDSKFSAGNPGIGFYLQGGTGALNADFGFRSITATGGSSGGSTGGSSGGSTGGSSGGSTGGSSGGSVTLGTLQVTNLRITEPAVSLAWDAVTQIAVDGYRIYYGPISGQENNVLDVGNVTNFTTGEVTNLPPGLTMHIVVRAYKGLVESQPSNRVSYVAGFPTNSPTPAPVITPTPTPAPTPDWRNLWYWWRNRPQ
jgi:hypothetical protein